MKKKLVEVVWHDILAEPGWTDDSDNDVLHPLKTYGLYLGTYKERKTGMKIVVIGNTYDTELKTIGDKNKIPKGCILEMNTICTVEI